MKKVTGALVAAVLTGTLLLSSGCSSMQKEKSLYEQGVEIISAMKEITENEACLNAVTNSAIVKSHLSHVGAEDPGKPKAVYEISMEEDQLRKILQLDTMGELSEALETNLKARGGQMLAGQFNLQGKAEEAAAANAGAVSRTFVNTDFTGNVMYLYLYEDAAPVVVSFSGGADHTVNAVGKFVLSEGTKLEGKEDIEAVFDVFPVEIREVKP